MNIEPLLAPISAEHPCGENLEYDAEFMSFERACAGKAEQQFGKTIIPAEAPDWRQVEKQGQALMTRSKDLRVILPLTEAWTHLNGLEGFEAGLSLLTAITEKYWEQLYPELNFDGEPDPLLRINTLASLGEQSSLMAALRQAKLLKSPSGEISFRDAAALIDGSKNDCAGYPGGLSRLQQELADGENPSVQTLVSIDASLRQLHQWVTGHLGESGMPDLSGLFRTLSALLQGYHQQQQARLQAQDEQLAAAEAIAGENTVTTATTTAVPPVTDWRQAQLTSKEDAQLMLEKVKQYFRQYEPSHPAPMMLERVERLIQLDFLEIIRELAPDAVNQLKGVLGRNDS